MFIAGQRGNFPSVPLQSAVFFFGGFPKGNQFRLRVIGQGPVRALFHQTETPLKLVTGTVQRVLRVHAVALRDSGGDKQHIPQLFPDAVGRVHVLPRFQRLAQFPDFLLQLFQRAERVVPVKARLDDLFLDFFRPPQRRKRMRHRLHGIGNGRVPLLPAFALFPVGERLFPVAGLRVLKHMRVAVEQFRRHTVDNVVHGKASPLRLNLRVKRRLQQHVSQLFAQAGGIVPVYRVQRLTGLLQKVPADRGVCLRPVPGAALRRTEQAHHLQKVPPSISVFFGKR